MERYKERLEEVKSLLNKDQIDLKRLREICSQSCPNEGGLRSVIWKILLNYLPSDRKQWTEILNKRRNEYRNFVRDMIIRPGYKENENCEIDHPLNSNPESEWSSFFKDNEVLVQIDKDVRRLCPDLFFFQKPTEFPCEEIKNVQDAEIYQSLRKRVAKTQLKADEVSKHRLGFTNYKSNSKKTKEEQDEYAYLPDGQEAHWEIIERILFIYAKLNRGCSYVQGMNEVLGPIYYIFANDPDIEWRRNAEADCFFCFNNLMGLEGIRENFELVLDNTQIGIAANMKRLYDLVRSNDPSVFNILQKQNLKPEFFAFRWITLLLSQEFKLPEVISLWDVLFADKETLDLLIHVCCAMILIQREHLLKGDFSANIKILQNYPNSVEIKEIVEKARNIRRK
ncbi:TBC1 domain family member 13 isoform X1 [Brachionus plicatilis]|uniref:TBC1 domain family member 13 isoform X1 n=1 Tax=Brachionus plicatilis TaxID=10195 RepID=A0A3M7SN31_BRAPC|nr:TBC1 domain family member 13 isoform X1 [Brachionus plicatilis]